MSVGLSVGQAILEKREQVNLIKFNKIHAFSQLLASAYGLVLGSIVSIVKIWSIITIYMFELVFDCVRFIANLSHLSFVGQLGSG